MPDAAWKCLERRIAKALGGKRLKRGDDFSASRPDVVSPRFLVEAKWGKQVPKFVTNALEQAQGYCKIAKYKDLIPLTVMKPKGKPYEVVIMTLDDFAKVLND